MRQATEDLFRDVLPDIGASCVGAVGETVEPLTTCVRALRPVSSPKPSVRSAVARSLHKVCATREAVARILGECTSHDTVQGGEFRTTIRQWGRCGVEVAANDDCGVGMVKGRVASQQMEGSGAQCVLVCAAVD